MGALNFRYSWLGAVSRGALYRGWELFRENTVFVLEMYSFTDDNCDTIAFRLLIEIIYTFNASKALFKRSQNFTKHH